MALYVHNSIDFKKKNQSINGNDIECTCTEIISKNAKNIIVSCICQVARGDSHKCLDKIKTLSRKNHEKPF